MENREAIGLIRQMIKDNEEDGGVEFGNKDKEALTLAISTLEKQDQTKEAIPHRNYKYLSDYWCECGWHLGKKGDVKFCADCGRRIKWD